MKLGLVIRGVLQLITTLEKSMYHRSFNTLSEYLIVNGKHLFKFGDHEGEGKMEFPNNIAIFGDVVMT